MLTFNAVLPRCWQEHELHTRSVFSLFTLSHVSFCDHFTKNGAFFVVYNNASLCCFELWRGCFAHRAGRCTLCKAGVSALRHLTERSRAEMGHVIHIGRHFPCLAFKHHYMEQDTRNLLKVLYYSVPTKLLMPWYLGCMAFHSSGLQAWHAAHDRNGCCSLL